MRKDPLGFARLHHDLTQWAVEAARKTPNDLRSDQRVLAEKYPYFVDHDPLQGYSFDDGRDCSVSSLQESYRDVSRLLYIRGRRNDDFIDASGLTSERNTKYIEEHARKAAQHAKDNDLLKHLHQAEVVEHVARQFGAQATNGVLAAGPYVFSWRYQPGCSVMVVNLSDGRRGVIETWGGDDMIDTTYYREDDDGEQHLIDSRTIKLPPL